MDKRYTKATIEKATGDADFIAVASTAIEDRHGEVISQDGWDLKAFKKNPVLLWAHDHNEPAVGTASKVWIEGDGKNAALMIKGKFHEFTDKARAIKQMVQEGIIKTMSVGFQPIEMEGNTYVKQELHEVSFVNVPANPNAMVSAYKSLKDAGFKNKTIAELGIPVAVLEQLEELKVETSELKKDFESFKKTVVKAQVPVNPLGRSRLVKERLSMHKVIAKAADKILEGKNALPAQQKTDLVKVIKRANDKLIVSHKEQLHGKN